MQSLWDSLKKGGEHVDQSKNWLLICECCNRSRKMLLEPYGYKCPKCGDMIGFDFKRLAESPINVFPELRK